MRPACLAALLAVTCHAQDPWSRADLVREGAVFAVSTVDWAQTLNITERPGYWEQNPVIGLHPTRGQVNRYFATSLLLHAGIVWVLPSRFRSSFQCASIGWELAIVGHNARLGLRITF